MTCFSIQKILRRGLLAFLLLPAFVVPSHARNQKAEESIPASGPTVIELFTATDCSACIYADRMLYDTSLEKNVIALSCHVGDTAGLKSGSEKDDIVVMNSNETSESMDMCILRQWAHRMSFVKDTVKVVLPAFLFNGNDFLPDAAPNTLATLTNSYRYLYKNNAQEILIRWKDKDTITIHLPQDPSGVKGKKSAGISLIRYKDMLVEKVDSGVNRGKVLRFSNVIQDVRQIGRWHHQMRTIEVDVPPPRGGDEHGGYVVLVQELLGTPILGAGKIIDYPLPNDLKR